MTADGCSKHEYDDGDDADDGRYSCVRYCGVRLYTSTLVTVVRVDSLIVATVALNILPPLEDVSSNCLLGIDRQEA